MDGVIGVASLFPAAGSASAAEAPPPPQPPSSLILSGKSTTLCVRRATYWCPDLGAEDPAKKGVCSNYLCDAKPGAEVKMTGPSGKVS